MVRLRAIEMAIALFCVIFLFGYGLLGYLPHYSSFDGSTWIDGIIPFIDWFIVFYLLGVFFAFLAFFAVPDRKRFWRMTRGFLIIMGVAFACFFLLPIELPKNVSYGEGIFSLLTQYWHVYDTTFNNFPSLHVAFTLYAWLIIFSEERYLSYLLAPFALGIILSVLFLKTHLVIDVIGGILLAGGVFWWWHSAHDDHDESGLLKRWERFLRASINRIQKGTK